MSLQLTFSQPQQRHLERLVEALIVSPGRKTLASLYRQWIDAPDESAVSDCLRASPWTDDELNQSVSGFALRDFLRRGEQEGVKPVLCVSADDSLTHKNKATHALAGVDIHHDHNASSNGKAAYGKGMVHVICRSLKPFKTEELYNQHIGEKVLAYLQKLPDEKRWDAVLVDEAHTFDKSWFPCCVAALKDTEDGDLMIVSDLNQGLYNRHEFSWKSVGVKAQGRSKKLAQNYRNTQEILWAAWDVLKPSKAKADSAFLAVKPSAALRHGPMPAFHLARSKWETIEQTLAQVQTLCGAGYSLSDIAIIYKYKSQQEADVFQRLLEQMEAKDMRPYWITADAEAKRTYDSQRPGVRIVTALSSLGLEFKVVLLLWVEQFWGCCDRDAAKAESDRRQLYVAMTRAQDELHLFAGGQTRIVQELRESGNFLLLKGTPQGG